MANKQRAEVEVAGAEGTYKFRLGSGAICRLEETLDMDVMGLFEQLQKGGVKLRMVREFVIASYVGEEELSKDEANDVIDDCGVVPLLGAMTDSIVATFNIPTEKSADPPKPKRAMRVAGSGSSSEPQKRAS